MDSQEIATCFHYWLSLDKGSYPTQPCAGSYSNKRKREDPVPCPVEPREEHLLHSHYKLGLMHFSYIFPYNSYSNSKKSVFLFLFRITREEVVGPTSEPCSVTGLHVTCQAVLTHLSCVLCVKPTHLPSYTLFPRVQLWTPPGCSESWSRRTSRLANRIQPWGKTR